MLLRSIDPLNEIKKKQERRVGLVKEKDERERETESDKKKASF